MFAGAGNIMRVPMSVHVQLEENGTFWCLATTNATAVYWIINGSANITADIRQTKTLTDDGFNLTMVVPGVKTYNNTLVQCCLYIQGQGQNCSEAVVMMIQGEYYILT